MRWIVGVALCAALSLGRGAEATGEVGEAVDAPGLVWRNDPVHPWFAQSESTHDSVDAIRSGAMTNNSISWVEADVTGPGRISFWWRASCEPGYDRATVLLGGVEQRNNWSDVTSWIFVQFNVPAGTHVIRWVYEKDGSIAEKEDAAWVDEVQFETTDKIFLEIEPDQYVGHEIWLPATEARREVLLLTSTNLVSWSTNAPMTTNMIRASLTNHERQFFRAIVRGN